MSGAGDGRHPAGRYQRRRRSREGAHRLQPRHGRGPLRAARLGPGFERWLIKLDGVAENRDREALADPQGYGTVEYAYWLMARDFGIEMTECRLFPEGGRRHFMTRRFDRDDHGKRKHVQTLAAIAHLDCKQATVHSYEEAFGVMSRLALPAEDFEQSPSRSPVSAPTYRRV